MDIIFVFLPSYFMKSKLTFLLEKDPNSWATWQDFAVVLEEPLQVALIFIVVRGLGILAEFLGSRILIAPGKQLLVKLVKNFEN